MEIIKKISAVVQGNSTKFYLVSANVILVVFAVWFSNVGLLPFKNAGDFAIFTVLALILAIYRPGWTFVLFIGAIVLENINLAPKSFGLMLRPYQFFGALTLVSLFVQFAAKRLPFALPKLKWFDFLLIVFTASGFLSSLVVTNKGASFKQAVIAATFVALYFLVRVYVQSLEDLKRIVPFFLSSAIVVIIYGIWQNVRFIHGGNPFEVMAGRPNAMFTEPDWLGIFLVFLLSMILTIIFYQSKKTRISNFQFSIIQFLNYLFLILVFITLILTVSRSAWLGTVLVTICFLKIMLTDGSLKMSQWNWKKFSKHSFFVIGALLLGIFSVYVLGLTRFQLASRAQSTGGLQKITIACEQNHPAVPQTIGNVSELEQYGCRHINLEDIEKEKTAGNVILETYRPDPNVGIRARIYKTTFEQIRQHPVFGIGWGAISAILGTDERGAGLNASNIFLEVWLGAGLLGILSFVILLGYIFAKGTWMFLDRKITDKTTAVFILLGWTAVVIPNLFNSGIFLGFVWVYLAIAISLLQEHKI